MAVAFLPPLPLGKDWDSLTSEKLEEMLKAEHLPGGSASMDSKEQIELKVGYVSDESTLGKPTSFEILAEAAIHRARILLDIANGKRREERMSLENKKESQMKDEEEEDKELSKSLREFRKKFGQCSEVSLEQVADVVFSSRTEGVKKEFLKRWCDLSEGERKKRGLSIGDLKRDRKSGVTQLDYPQIKKDLLEFVKQSGDAIKRDLQRKSGKKGGKKAQGNAS